MDQLWSFYQNVNREDIEVVEMVEQGLQNDCYNGGRMSFRFEETIHRFHNLVIDYMLGRPRVYECDALHEPGKEMSMPHDGHESDVLNTMETPSVAEPTQEEAQQQMN